MIAALSVAFSLGIALVPAPTAQQVGGVSQLVWFDRAGVRLGEVGSFGDIGNIELSPDGRQVAVALIDPARGTRDLWMYDVETGARTRFTSGPADENWLIWSPDGQRVVFNSFGATLELYEGAADGSTVPDLLRRDGDAMWPVSWSPDGERILVVTNSADTGNDIWVLPRVGEEEPAPLFRTRAAENWAAFSPDGRWIAYSASDTGTSEVYVTRYPVTGQRWQVSIGGGTAARWRDDGLELYFVAPDRWLVAALVDGDDEAFVVGARERLFETRYPYPPFHSFDVSANGQRFLVNTAVAAPTAPGVSASLEQRVRHRGD
jgi:Tol biopolymer transport system component